MALAKKDDNLAVVLGNQIVATNKNSTVQVLDEDTYVQVRSSGTLGAILVLFYHCQ